MIFNMNKNKYMEELLKEGAEEEDTPQEDTGGSDTQQDNATEDNDNSTDNNTNNNDQDTNNDDMDLPEDDAGGEDDMGDDFGDEGGEGDDMGSDDMGDDTQETDPNDIIKQSEEELFSNLTQIEIEMKHEELKKNFLDLYDSIDKLIERINNIKKTQNSLAVAEYASNTISEMKSLIYTYITKSYDKKSYTESSIMFNKCLVVLRGIDDLLNTIIKYELKDKIKENS